ncbi:MAG TPA: NAD(P)H-binding protein [Steroidobacteraceae bacterium]|jgi:NAD(P)H dehydrogenase (quinone)|nr:NAD(P)H-binding protein [Steroidobacteraceae bacterium]
MLLISVAAAPIPRPLLHKRAFDAAVKDGVKQIVYTSYLGVGRDHSPLSMDHGRSEQYLKASGAAWTILRNGFYADMRVPQAAQMVAAGRVTVAADEAKTAWVTRADCAAAAAGALTTPGHENKVYDITGPALIGRGDVARLASQITGKPIEVIEQTAGNEQGTGRAGARPAAGLDLPPPIVSNAVAELSGHAATSVRALLEANKQQLLAAPAAR